MSFAGDKSLLCLSFHWSFLRCAEGWPRVALACSGLKQGFGSWPEIEVGFLSVREPNPSDKISGQWPDLAHHLWRKEFPQRQEVVKQEKLIRRKKSTVWWIDTWMDSEEELCPRGSLNHFLGAFVLSFLWPIILLCLVLSQYLVNLRILPCVCTHLLVKADSTERPMGRRHHSPFDLQGLFWLRRFPWLWVWDTHGLSSAQGPATSLDFPAINILELLSTGNELKLLTPGGGGHLPPASGAQVRLLQLLPAECRCCHNLGQRSGSAHPVPLDLCAVVTRPWSGLFLFLSNPHLSNLLKTKEKMKVCPFCLWASVPLCWGSLPGPTSSWLHFGCFSEEKLQVRERNAQVTGVCCPRLSGVWGSRGPFHSSLVCPWSHPLQL